MSYGGTSQTLNGERVIDLRSDTSTAPDAAMRQFMAAAPVGDDCSGEDISVNTLQAEVASLAGKEAGLFVPSGTQGNLICALLHGRGMFSELIMGDASHTANFETSGCSVFGGISIRHVRNLPDGTLDFVELERRIHTKNDIHKTRTTAVFLENTHMTMGGKVLPMSYIREVRVLCDRHGINLHCDAARIWNAAVALDLPLHDVLAPFDTASICLSKGLGAPVGSVIVGPADFIEDAKHVRKALGGGMRQVGIIAAGALYALHHLRDRMREDHEMARVLASGLREVGIVVEEPQSNIVSFRVSETAEQAIAFTNACAERGLRLYANVAGPGTARLIPHYGITTADIKVALEVLKSVYVQQKKEN